MPWDSLGLAYAPITELDLVTSVSALDWVPFHDMDEDKVVRITAADLGVAPLTTIDLATTVTTSGTESWYNVTGTSTITLNATPDDGDMVRVTLDGVTSVAMVGTINGNTNPSLIGDKNSFDIVYALAATEWKIV